MNIRKKTFSILCVGISGLLHVAKLVYIQLRRRFTSFMMWFKSGGFPHVSTEVCVIFPPKAQIVGIIPKNCPILGGICVSSFGDPLFKITEPSVLGVRGHAEEARTIRQSTASVLCVSLCNNCLRHHVLTSSRRFMRRRSIFQGIWYGDLHQSEGMYRQLDHSDVWWCNVPTFLTAHSVQIIQTLRAT